MRGTQNLQRRSLLQGAGDSVEAAGERFRQAAREGALHDLDASRFTVPGISASDAVRWAYENGMVSTRDGRAVYDKIMAAPADETCPLCGHGSVRTLDHFLPKRMFPALCVDPLNLVPACADCNHAKGDGLPSTAGTTPLHPYLDRIDHDPWLDAKVTFSSPIWLDAAGDSVLDDGFVWAGRRADERGVIRTGPLPRHQLPAPLQPSNSENTEDVIRHAESAARSLAEFVTDLQYRGRKIEHPAEASFIDSHLARGAGEMTTALTLLRTFVEGLREQDRLMTDYRGEPLGEVLQRYTDSSLAAEQLASVLGKARPVTKHPAYKEVLDGEQK
ncbi:HNH endonuclease [Streptomyces sp. S1D4-11]